MKQIFLNYRKFWQRLEECLVAGLKQPKAHNHHHGTNTGVIVIILWIVLIEIDSIVIIPIVVAIGTGDKKRRIFGPNPSVPPIQSQPIGFSVRIELGSNVVVYVLFICGSLAYQRVGVYSPRTKD
ncbi:hypothetical protein M0P48_00250 [Candidatus Gracilibacteria bacterium]|nr:hypothetical protein [Candidatus Gracilibacteria bacterium]